LRGIFFWNFWKKSLMNHNFDSGLTKPHRIQLSRAAGWRMPPNTIKVDRTTKWGNPFIVGANGNAEDCVLNFRRLLGGYTCISMGQACEKRQEASFAALKKEKEEGWRTLRGKNLVCWCALNKPCHADVLLEIANRL
jgi:hypothetical protein